MAKRVRRFRPRQMPPDPRPAPPPVPPAVDRAWELVSTAQAEQPQPGRRRVLRPRDPAATPVKIVVEDPAAEGKRRRNRDDIRHCLNEFCRYGELLAQDVNRAKSSRSQRHVNTLQTLPGLIDELLADW